MDRVTFDVTEDTFENGDGREVDGLCVKCNRCDHTVEVFGTSDKSVRRGAVMLREQCPGKEENFYVPDRE